MKRFIIAGLGNPGISYARHRHNVGFMVLDNLAHRHQVAFKRVRRKYLHAEFHLNDAHILLAKPQTYVNQSGDVLKNLLHYFHLPLEQALIVFDDLDLPIAELRMRPHGGSAGHKGMQSIIDCINSRSIPRLRVGIDRPPGRKDPADYVLQPFSSEEQELIEVALSRAADAIETFVNSGIQIAMSTFNGSFPGK